MSDNLRLYIKDNSGNPVEINPLTVANAVNISSNNIANVQSFIDNPYQNEDNADIYQYVSANCFKSYTNTFENTIKEKYNELLNFNNLIYCGTLSLDNEEIYKGFEGLKDKSIKCGSVYKIITTDEVVTYFNNNYKNGDFIFFIKYVDKSDEWYKNEEKFNKTIDKLGGNNSGLGIDSVVSYVVDNYDELLTLDTSDYQIENDKNFYTIVVNDKKHNGLLSFYEYCESIEDSIEPGQTWELKNSIEEMEEIKKFIISPKFNYTINEEKYIIILNEYNDTDFNINDIQYSLNTLNENVKYVKIKNDELNYDYYKWNGYRWVYLGNNEIKWKYLFSHEEDSKINNSLNELEEETNKKINDLIKYVLNSGSKTDYSISGTNIRVVNQNDSTDENNVLYFIRE